MKQIHKYGKSWIGPGGQRGGLTIFSAALILILMTMVLVYATRVSIFESRVSGNEVRQKEAFHVAEAALEQSVMYLLSNANVILSERENVFADGTADSFTKDGWLSGANKKWELCSVAQANGADMTSHPCGGDVAASAGAYYYDIDPTSDVIDALPVHDLDIPTGSTARVSALMCFIDLDNPTNPCQAAPVTAAEEANSTLMITLLAYGYSDCTDTTDVTTCTGEATVALPISNYRKLAGPPAVPFVSKSTGGQSGTVEVVGNRSGGGGGVPLTTWLPTDTYLTDSSDGSTWQTCEMEEWYGTNERPEDVACSTITPCKCGSGGNDTSYFLSWNHGGDPPHIGIDIVEDPNFPTDLFEFNFGVPRALYTQVKATARPVDADKCKDELGTQSSGLIWINGGECIISGGTTVGSPLDPVIIVSAADKFTLGGGAVIFGLLYIFDGDLDGSNPAELKAVADAVVYGAVIVDGSIDTFGAGFAIVYNEDVLTGTSGIAGLGSVNGGWRDFGLPDIAW